MYQSVNVKEKQYNFCILNIWVDLTVSTCIHVWCKIISFVFLSGILCIDSSMFATHSFADMSWSNCEYMYPCDVANSYRFYSSQVFVALIADIVYNTILFVSTFLLVIKFSFSSAMLVWWSVRHWTMLEFEQLIVCGVHLIVIYSKSKCKRHALNTRC